MEIIKRLMKTLKDLERIRDKTNDPKLKESISKKIAILKGDKIVTK